MRTEVLDYFSGLRLNIPSLIERGREHRWKVNKKQVEAACEFVYLQIHEKGLNITDHRIKLGPYILNRAKKIKMGRYYRMNLGDPVLLDDLTAIRDFEANLFEANTKLKAAEKILLIWKIAAYVIFVGLSFVIFKTNWYY